MILLRFPPRFAMMALLAMCLVILLLNLGTMTTELKANAGVRRFLEKHLARWPAAQEKLHGYLHRAATREVGDMLRSPRFFLFSAMPGTSSSRPVKGNEPPDQGSSS
jgi:hypothetical protein